jgi:hypothetical protein
MGNTTSHKWSDYYSLASPWYWVLQICVTLYGMGAMAYLVLVQNVHVVDTVFESLPGGTYYTGRYISFVWYAIMLSCCRILVYPIVNATIMFRGSRGCSIFWYIWIVLLVLIDVLVIVGLGSQYGSCNANGARDNLCNDARWCCAPEIYSAASNGCFNTGPCTPPIASISALAPNPDFLWLFWVNFTFLFLDIAIMLFFGLAFAFCPVYSTLEAKEQEEEKEEEEGETAKPIKGQLDQRNLSPTRASTKQRK